MKNILLIIIVIVAVVLGALWGKTLVDKSKLEENLTDQINIQKQTIKKKSTELEAANKNIKNIEAKLQKVSAELKSVKEGQLSAAKSEIAKREEKITELQNASEDLQSKLATLNKQLETLQADVDTKSKSIANLKKIIDGKDSRIKELNDTVNSWIEKEKAATKLATTYKRLLLENKIPLEPEKKFAGHVLTIHKNPDFMIIDLGVVDALPVGKELNVVRDNHFIGKVTVQKLLPEDNKLSYVIVKSLVDENNPVKEGDIVKN